MLSFLSGGGEAGALLRQHDWAGTALGAPESWSPALKALVGVMLGANQPMFVVWGQEQILLYNDGYAEILADKHPAALGAPFLEVWREIAADLLPVVTTALGGTPVHMDDITLFIERKGHLEEAHFAFSYTPVRDEAGRVSGFFCPCNETTQQVITERRLAAEMERKHQLFQRAPGFMTILIGPEHVFEFVNDAFATIFGARDFVGRRARDVFPELSEQDFFFLLDRVYRTGERYVAHHVPIELRNRPDRATERHVLDFIYEPIKDSEGHVTGIFCEGHDVTEQVEAQSALRASEARYRQIVEGAEDFAILTQDEHGIIRSWNRGAERLTGFAEAEALGAAGSIFFTEEDIAAGVPDHEMAKCKSDGRFVNERWHRRKDGSRFWGSGLMMALEDGGFLKMFRDRTAEHQADSALRASEEQFRAFAQAMPNHVWTAPPDGMLDWFNDRILRYSGLTVEEMAGTGWTAMVHPEDLPAARQAWGAALASGERYEIEFRLRAAEGGYRWHIARAVKIDAGLGGERWVGTNTDIDDQKRAVAALAELNRTLEQQVAERTADRDRVWRNSRDLLVIIGTDGIFRAVNPAWTDILGYAVEEVVGQSYKRFLFPEDRAEAQAAHDRAAKIPDLPAFETRFRHKDGSLRWISWHTSAEGDLIFAYGRDVTLEKRRQADLELAQEALRQSQKLEAMGQLTGGVAHDFNNLLSPIVGSLDLLHRRKLGGEREHRLIDGALQAAERAKTLVQRLLAFARRQPLQASAVDISNLISGMAELVASTSGPQIEMVIDVPPELPPAKADPNQLEMAILNLSVNARDAMPGGGTMTILARSDEVRAGESADLAPGRYIRLSIADTGIGMDEETMVRAVEPFYSTKGIGKGTGLGLSMVHGLASQLGGALRLSSTPGSGTKVDLWLPVSDEAVREDDAFADRTESPHRAGVALLVDDEDIVRLTTADMLAELGFEVHEANSAETALDCLGTRRGFDILVTDHLMPGMTGAELAAIVRERWPDIRILIVSGYADADGISADLPRLTKPFRQAELQASLAELLPHLSAS